MSICYGVAVTTEHRFATEHLVVDEWHTIERDFDSSTELPLVVRSLLTPSVTASLPVAWQGPYTDQRAREWIDERDQEGTTLLVIDRSSAASIGLLILFADDPGIFRIGYIFAESACGKGFATELILGFVAWCRDAGIQTIIAGVSADNPASQRVLAKCGFSESPVAESPQGVDTTELLYELQLQTT